MATFSVDDGFAYSVPEGLSGLEIGSIVRVPLGGRRVRGYVVGLRPLAGETRRLKDVIGLSGELPVFNEPMLQTLRWLSIHYVAPLAALLRRSAPPNLPRRPAVAALPVARDRFVSPLPEATARAVEGHITRPQYLVKSGVDGHTVAALVTAVLAAGHNALVIAPTVVECDEIAGILRSDLGPRVLQAHSALSAREVTTAWTRSAIGAGTVVVGTREAALWPINHLAMAVVVEEGRRAMKSTQTPTVHVREILRRRAAVERFQLVFAGPMPTTESVAVGVDIHEPAGRAWPLVELVDRSEEPPGSGLVVERVRRAVSMAANADRRCFVLVHRRGYAPAFRCIRCRQVRRCDACGAAADRGDVCRRCGNTLGECTECGGSRFEPLGAGIGRIVDDLRRTIGDRVAPVGGGEQPVLVGTERDIPLVGPIDLAVAVDADGLIHAPHYRAGENALFLLARLAAKVRPGSGNRCIVQTGMPRHAVLEALRSGHPMSFLETEIRERSEAGFPPGGELIALDVRRAPEGVDSDLRGAAGKGVLGPAESNEGLRWLIQGRDLRSVKIRMRSLVQKWRDAGARVRVDVDPLEL